MKHKNDVYDLIQSLSKSELRYVQLSLRNSRHEQSDYSILLKEFRKQKEYNEALIKDQFKGTSFVKQFDVKKHYLYNSIIKHLHAYHHNKNKHNKIPEHVDLLISKGLFNQALRTTKSGLSKAIRREDFSLILRLLDQKERISHYLPDQINRSEIQQKLAHFLRLYQLHFHYSSILIEIKSLAEKYTFCRTKEHLDVVGLILKDPLMELESEPVSIKCRKIYWEIKYLVAGTSGRWKEAMTCALNELNVLQNDSLDKNLRMSWMDTVCVHLITSSIHTKNFIESEKWIDKFIKLGEQIHSQEELLRHEFRFVFYRLVESNKSRKILKDSSNLQLAEDFLNEHIDKVEPSSVNYLLFEIAKSYFHLGNYKEASKYNMKVLVNSETSTYSHDLYAFSAIFDLVLSFEKRDMDLIESRCRRTRSNLKKRKILYSFEDKFLKLAQTKLGAVTFSDKEEISNTFKGIQGILEPLYSNEPGHSILNYFDFDNWIKSKIN